jgi:cytochrome c553
VNLPEWERLLWRGRPWRPAQRCAGEHYQLTDFRLLRIARDGVDEIALDDITDVQRTETRLDRVLGTSTIAVHGGRACPIVLVSVRRGQQLAALLELLAGDPRVPREAEATRSALAWNPRSPSIDLREALGGLVAVLIALVAVVFGLHGRDGTVSYAADDAIAPNGEKRSEAAIVAFMEHDVLPWARRTLGPIKGGADRITCGTCHGAQPESRNWQMPAVAALPQADVRERGWEIYTTTMDAQMRNAIYGYIAESDNQAKAAYMREIVVPGMARLLHRPAYDFTKSYEYNRSRRALGCYHCHRVK